MEPTETNPLMTFFLRLRHLFNKPKDNGYDQLIYNIRLLVFLTGFALNFLGVLFDPYYTLQLTLILCLTQLVQLYFLVNYNNNYLIGLVFQIHSLTFLIIYGADIHNLLSLPMAMLSLIVLYSLQFYPLSLNLLFIAISFHFMLGHKQIGEDMFSYNETFLTFVRSGGEAWVGTALVIFSAINVFQVHNMKVWRAYITIKQQLVEKNIELHQANQKMEKMVQNLKDINQQLEISNKNLSEALKSQDLFVACVSHELRTPLNAMIGNIELLQLETFEVSKKKMLKTCQICGEILLVMINNILDVAKIHASKLEISVSAMNMSHFIEKIWSVSCPRILQKDLYGKLLISKDVPLWLKGDFHRLIQIIINLVGNATKFTTKGGVKVMISWENDHDISIIKDYNKEEIDIIEEDDLNDVVYPTECLPTIPSEDGYVNEVFRLPNVSDQMKRLNHEKWICLSEQDDNFTALQRELSVQYNKTGTLKIRVIDTGCGISTGAHSRIFEPFVQADSSITRKYGGTGLGLYIIKELLNKMNGTINISSQVNKGAKFTIKIPLSTILPEEASYSKEIIFPSYQDVSKDIKAPVLIVDDSHYNQNILKTYLDTLKIPSETADNGVEAVDKIKSHPLEYYSMIMMDIQMPVMDGITACKRIRQYEKERKSSSLIPITIVTANCTSAEQSECMTPSGEIKAAYFFRKPFSYSDCKLSVEAIITQKKIKMKKVLVVDDDAFNRDLLQTQIRRIGLECEACKNGFEALRKLRENSDIAVVLTDFEMPVMNGIEVARRIRQELKMKDLYVVGITGNVEEELNKLSLVNGMNKVLTKPVSLNQISNLFKEYKLI